MAEALAEPFPTRVPSDKPEIEVLRGVELSKVSPRRTHGILQGVFFEILNHWAAERGDVGTEWRFHLPGFDRSQETTLIPDVALVFAEALDHLTDSEVEEPHLAPTIVIEIRSPEDRPRNIAAKTRLYLEAGTRLVFDVDPASRTIVVHDGVTPMEYRDGTVFEHPATPGLQFDVTAVFDRTKRKRTRPRA